MTAENFQACLAFTLKYEGGRSNDPRDSGGRTMQGVTQATYDAYRDRRGGGRRTVYAMLPSCLQSDFIMYAPRQKIMTSQEIAAGVIEYATKNNVTLRAEGDVLIMSYPADHEPDDALRAMIKEQYRDIVDILKGMPQ